MDRRFADEPAGVGTVGTNFLSFVLFFGPLVGLQVPLLESWWRSMTTILIGDFPYRELIKATEDVDIELGEMG